MMGFIVVFFFGMNTKKKERNKIRRKEGKQKIKMKEIPR